MSAKSDRNLKRQVRFRNRNGEDVTFNGKTYRCLVEEVSGAKAGEQAVPRGTYGPQIASTVPAIFDFNPSDFAPWTDDPRPVAGSVLVRMGYNYEVEAPDFENEDTDTTGFFVFALRQLWAAPTAP